MGKFCLIIPVYNHEKALTVLLKGLRTHGLFCILVDDASSPDSAQVLDQLAEREKAWIKLLRHPVNLGKGGAVMTALRAASEEGYSHALQIDADGQHDPADVPRFVAVSKAHPDALICGAPVFDTSVPKSRLWGRKLTNVWIWINTLSFEIRDGLCGYRLYPLQAVMPLLSNAKLGLRMDFDPEILVRLKWQGRRVVTLPVKVRYPLDGISHFKLGLDNWLISKMHARSFLAMLLRLPWLLWNKPRGVRSPKEIHAA